MAQDNLAAGLVIGLALAKSPQDPSKNPHVDPNRPPRLSDLNAKLASATVKYGSTDRTHHIEVVVKSGPTNNIAAGEVLFRVTFGTPYAATVYTIGIPAVPQTAGYEAQLAGGQGYLLASSGLQNGSVISIRPIVVEATDASL